MKSPLCAKFLTAGSESMSAIVNAKPAPQRGFIYCAGQLRRAVGSFHLSLLRRWLAVKASSTAFWQYLLAAESGRCDRTPSVNRTPAGDARGQRQSTLSAEAKLPPRLLEWLSVKSNAGVLFVKIEDIDWIGAADNYVDLHVGPQSHLLRETLSVIETRLAPEKFVRISRSAIVNVGRLKELQLLNRGAGEAILEDGTRLALSRRYRSKLKQLFRMLSPPPWEGRRQVASDRKEMARM